MERNDRSIIKDDERKINRSEKYSDEFKQHFNSFEKDNWRYIRSETEILQDTRRYKRNNGKRMRSTSVDLTNNTWKMQISWKKIISVIGLLSPQLLPQDIRSIKSSYSVDSANFSFNRVSSKLSFIFIHISRNDV